MSLREQSGKGHSRDRQSGFTLLELIVTTAIIGVLAAIAIPQYAGYKSRAVDSLMLSDLKNGRTAMEAYFIEQFVYLAPGNESVLDVDYGYNPTSGATLSIQTPPGPADFVLCSCSVGGDGSFPCFKYDSQVGYDQGAPAASCP